MMITTKKKDFYKELMTLAIPIGLQNLLVALIGASDALMLGRLTQDAIAYKKDEIHPDIRGLFTFSGNLTKSFLKVAAPMLSSSLAWGIGFSMHSLIMGHLGTDATAAASVVSVAQELITCLCKGVSAGAGIMIGKELGKNMLDRAREYGKEFCHCSFWIGFVNAALLCLVGPAVTLFFVLSETAKHYLIIMLFFSALYLFAFSINTIIVVGFFPAGGDSRYDAISVLFATWCFALPIALLGTFVFHWPVMLVYILLCSDEIVKLPWIYPRYKKYIWLKNLTQDES